MKNSKFVLLTLAAGLLNAEAVTVINTMPRDSTIHTFGEPHTATYGQTFIVPAIDNVLDSFSFELGETEAPGVDFKFYVMAWDGAKATGAVLFESSVQVETGDFTTYTFTPGIALTPGGSYVAFINNSDLQSVPPTGGGAEIGSRLDVGLYPDGRFVFLNNGPDFSRITVDDWTQDFGFGLFDLAFIAEFSHETSLPDTGNSLVFLGTALALLGLWKRK